MAIVVVIKGCGCYLTSGFRISKEFTQTVFAWWSLVYGKLAKSFSIIFNMIF